MAAAYEYVRHFRYFGRPRADCAWPGGDVTL